LSGYGLERRTLRRRLMDRLEFEAEARREGYRVVYASLKPNLAAPNHCHDFDTKLLFLVAKSP
jgi:hypothetical protein